MRIRWRNFELPSKVQPDADTLSKTFGRFVIEPFERGFGHTIGNGLRRVLLSSIEGTAVVSVRIEGAQHEFDSLEGVLEDVTDVILNLKRLRIAFEGGDEVTCRIEKSTKGAITGADVICPGDAQVANPELHIATLTKDRPLRIELRVKRGRGYVAAEETGSELQQLGTIPVDAIFSPVHRVRYSIEATRVGKLTNYDRLILEIWTDGTKDPEFALVEAAKIMRKHLNPFVQYFEMKDQYLAEGAKVGESGKKSDEIEKMRMKLMRPITELDLNVRANNCMRAERIHTIADLVSRKEDDLLEIRNLGKTTLKEIKKKIEDMGLAFGMNLAEMGIDLPTRGEAQPQEVGANA